METQKISETLVEGSVDYKPVLSQTPDGKTLEKVSVVSSLSESGAVSESVTVTEVPSGVGNANVHKNIENVVDGTELELMGVGFEQKLVDGYDNIDSEVKSEERVVDGYDNIDSEGVKSDEKLANVDYNNGLESVDTEQKLVDGHGTVESENKLANVDDYNDLEGVEIENKFGDVDDTIDLEALGLENEDVSLDGLMEGGTLKHGTQESGAEFNESLDNGVEKIGVADAVEDIDTSKVHVNDSPTKIEVSGNGISLTVDVFGPDCTFYMETDNPMGVNGNEAEGNVSDNQEHNFAVGDLVWVKMKTDLWWPGMICDPHTTKDAGKCNHMDGFFVKHFGNTSSVWCRPFQLKPFIGYFELMSRQNKSRSFYAAIEKALGEFGRRVKQEMTCSCFSKENQVAAQNFPSKEDENGGSVFSASQFEPSNLLEFIKSRALGLRSPGNVEFTVAENCLSAFYTSIGHKQLPLYKLRPTNNLISVSKDEDLDKLSSGDSVLKSCRSGSDDIKMTEMELSGSLESPRGMRSMISHSQIANENAGGKSFESRERKKSKYLSYPYVNSWASRKNSLGQGEDETEDCEEVTPGGGKTSSNPSVVSTSIGNNSNKTSLRKSRKSVNDNDICNNADFGAASSAEMLQELHQTALDCFYPIQSTCPIPIRDFYLSFRAFRDPEVQMDEYKEATLGCQETLQSDNILASGGYDLQVEGQPPPNVLPKKRGRKKSDGINATGPKFSSKTNLPRMTADGTSMNGSPLIDSVQTGPDTLKKGVVHRQRKKAAIAAVVHNEIGVLGGLPDLNVNNAGLSVENMQVIGPAPTQGKLEPKRRRRKKEELVSENLPDVSKGNTQFIPMLKSVEVTGSLPLEGGPQPDNMFGVQGACSLPNAELLAGQSNANEIHAAGSSLPNISQITGLVSSAKAEGKKRKRKEKALNIQNNSSALPDLNGQVTDPNMKGKEVTEMSCVSGQAKPKQKRRRATKSAAIGIPNPNGDHNTLLLYFTPGSPVPSKEYITATFASFGPLEESKTLYLNDSTAQVVFEKDSDAMEALQSLQSRNPFGPSLVSYRLRHVSTCNNTQTSHPADALQSPSVLSGGEGPDLVVIKQNLESMTTMLEKAGDNISPEMKAKLESEVKGFLEKVSNMVGSSSS